MWQRIWFFVSLRALWSAPASCAEEKEVQAKSAEGY